MALLPGADKKCLLLVLLNTKSPVSQNGVQRKGSKRTLPVLGRLSLGCRK